MSYSDSLKGPEKERYERKLQCLYGVTGRSSKEECVEVLDPYNISVELWIDDVSRWPLIEFPHVYTYLIDTPGEFTREKLKAFKSLQAYNYYISGWVRTVYYRDIGNENCILMAKVTPSQRINDKPHEAWIGVNKKTGTIITGHCSCMAGLGEVCSHVAAILFKAEACIRLGIASETCTSQPCLWNQAYSKKVTELHSKILSTAEAEYMALCETVKEAVYLQQLLEEIGLKALPVTIYEDNQPCIHIASNPVTSNRSKHIAVRYHYVREVISNGKVQVLYKSTQEMVADCLTKNLAKDKVEKFRSILLGMS